MRGFGLREFVWNLSTSTARLSRVNILGFCLEYTLAESTKQRFNKISNSSPKHSLVAGFVCLSEESTCALILHFDPLCKPFCLVLQMPMSLM